MAVELRSVYSSHVREIGYDADAQALHVVYSNGKHAVYSGVPPDVADSVLTSPSIGEALKASVRDAFPFSYA